MPAGGADAEKGMSKKAPTEEEKADKWFRYHAEPFLRSIGVRECLRVADVGCHNGRFTLPAARIVGSCGIVYAIDKDRDVLASVKQTIEKEARHNIRIVEADLSKGSVTRMSPHLIDMALLYDMLHCGYLPDRRDRRNVLKHVHAIIKPGGVLSCFPTHLKKYGFTFEALLREITEAGFVLKGEFRPHLVHDGRLVRGRLFRFEKPEEGGYK
jgi:ubiquinone/menaquinone biosynthesis C-methylase UbiE